MNRKAIVSSLASYLVFALVGVGLGLLVFRSQQSDSTSQVKGLSVVSPAPTAKAGSKTLATYQDTDLQFTAQLPANAQVLRQNVTASGITQAVQYQILTRGSGTNSLALTGVTVYALPISSTETSSQTNQKKKLRLLACTGQLDQGTSETGYTVVVLHRTCTLADYTQIDYYEFQSATNFYVIVSNSNLSTALSAANIATLITSLSNTAASTATPTPTATPSNDPSPSSTPTSSASFLLNQPL